MIGIVDYGMGNVGSIFNMYQHLEIPAAVARSPEDLKGATHLILPGVGIFDEAMQRLDSQGWTSVLDDIVKRRRLPVLGICLGAQLITERSEEGELPGLGWIPGRVVRFDDPALKVPHMGWNLVHPRPGVRILEGLDDSRFYFVHSYHVRCDKRYVAGTTTYGHEFPSVIHRDNVHGVQFHPEKSHRFGMRLLQNFAELD